MRFLVVIFGMILAIFVGAGMAWSLPSGDQVFKSILIFSVEFLLLLALLFTILIIIERQYHAVIIFTCLISFLYFAFQVAKPYAEENNVNKAKIGAVSSVTPEPKSEAPKENPKAAPALNSQALKNVEGDKQTEEKVKQPEKPEDGEIDDGVTRYSI